METNADFRAISTENSEIHDAFKYYDHPEIVEFRKKQDAKRAVPGDAAWAAQWLYAFLRNPSVSFEELEDASSGLEAQKFIRATVAPLNKYQQAVQNFTFPDVVEIDGKYYFRLEGKGVIGEPLQPHEC